MKYLRVSEILARLQNFSNIDETILNTKQEIGTRTHKAITLDAQGLAYDDLCERSAAYMQSYRLFKEAHDPSYVMMEARFYDDNIMITGEVDAIAKRDGDIVILDWKTSAKPNLPIWEMQAHFYWYLVNANKIPVGNRMIWVNLRHKKQAMIDEDGHPILGILDEPLYEYVGVEPKVCEFHFKQEVLLRCIEEAEKAWNEKKRNFEID